MTYKEAIKDIEGKNFKPLYFLCGEESYFTDELVQKLQSEVLTEDERAFNEVIIYGKEADDRQLLDQLMRYPMMAERQLVVLKEAQVFKKWDGLIHYFENPNEQTVFVVAYKGKSPDKRKKWVKSVSKSKNSVFVESKKIYDNQLPAWIKTYVKSHGFDIDAAASRLLSIYLGADLSRISSEINKLFINKANKEKITLQDIESNIGISKSYNVFELLNALGQRNISKTNFILKNLTGHLNTQPIQMILPAIHRFFQRVYAIKSMGPSSDSEIASKLNIYSTYFVRDFKAASKHFSLDQLEDIFSLFYEYDLRSKGINGSRQKDSEILVELVQRILYV